MTTEYYVYILSRPDGTPFYVGKGCNLRVFMHEKEARTDCNCDKCQVIREIWTNGGCVQKSIIFDTFDEGEAFRVEADMIAKFGIESLCNRTKEQAATKRSATMKRIRKHEDTRINIARAELSLSMLRRDLHDANQRLKLLMAAKSYNNKLELRRAASLINVSKDDFKSLVRSGRLEGVAYEIPWRISPDPLRPIVEAQIEQLRNEVTQAEIALADAKKSQAA